MNKLKSGLIVLTLALAACKSAPLAVPVVAAPSDLRTLSGRWEGEYDSKERNGRSGTIYFDLKEGRDTANGYVVMTFRRPREPAPPMRPRVQAAPPMQSEPLSITFIRARNGLVTGELDRYTDPDCGCRLQTTFSGRIKGNVVSGTFVTRHIDTGTIVRGGWSARKLGNP